jgi:cytochrome c
MAEEERKSPAMSLRLLVTVSLAASLASCLAADPDSFSENTLRAEVYEASQGGSLGFDGTVLRPDCTAMASWYQCRNVQSAPPLVRQGYEYIHHTSSTLGPDGIVRFPDGSPYAVSSTACSNCHFSGGQVPFGMPFYQTMDKYASRPLFRAFNYRRDARDAVLDCFRNCMGNTQVPPKDDPVIDAIMAYIAWVRAGVTDPTLLGPNWQRLPGESWDYFTSDWMAMRADVTRGQAIYQRQCARCHSRDGAGQGEYRRGEHRPRVPALWGPRSFTRGAAMYSVPQLAFVVRRHMPYGDPQSLTEQQALDVAGYINTQPRPVAHAARMFCDNDASGIPNSLYKPAHWNVGCTHPAEPFTETQRLLGPWAPIAAWRNAQIAALTRR